MPKLLEKNLRAKAKKKFPNDKKKQDAYIYGTLRKARWTPKPKKKKIRRKSKKKTIKRRRKSAKKKG